MIGDSKRVLLARSYELACGRLATSGGETPWRSL